MGFLQRGSTLTPIIESNTTVTNLQSDVFHFAPTISGTVSFGSIPLLALPVANVTVNLEDTDGDILATTKNNAMGAIFSMS